MTEEKIENFLYSYLKEFIGKPKNEETKLAIKEKLFKLYEESIDNYEKLREAVTKSISK
jgi:hypothetical protein